MQVKTGDRIYLDVRAKAEPAESTRYSSAWDRISSIPDLRDQLRPAIEDRQDFAFRSPISRPIAKSRKSPEPI